MKKVDREFLMLPKEVVTTKIVDRNAVIVYCQILSFTERGKNGCFNGSNDYLALVTGMSRTTVIDKLKILRENKWIFTNGLTNEYRRIEAVPISLVPGLEEEYAEFKYKLQELVNKREEDKRMELERKAFFEELNKAKLEAQNYKEKIAPFGERETKSSEIKPTEFGDNNNSDNNSDKKNNKNHNKNGNNNLENNPVVDCGVPFEDSSNIQLTIGDDDTPIGNELVIPTMDDLKFSPTDSEDVLLFKELWSQFDSDQIELHEVFEGFTTQTKRKVVSYAQADKFNPTRFMLNGKTINCVKFDSKDFLVIDGQTFSEIISQYS